MRLREAKIKRQKIIKVLRIFSKGFTRANKGKTYKFNT
jgi:hypothetical protein